MYIHICIHTHAGDRAVNVKTGTSVSAALVAGAAAIVRQYLYNGYYPEGFKNAKNVAFRTPSAAMIKAMLVNSARTVGGTVDVYVYAKEPPCLSESGTFVCVNLCVCVF